MRRMVLFGLFGVCALCLSFDTAPGAPASGLYQITSGTYTACCGIAGEVRRALPSEDQAFVKLAVDPEARTATMTFLGRDRNTVFSVFSCPSTEPIYFTFDHGFVGTNRIIFHADPGPPPIYQAWDFGVTNWADALRVDGTMQMSAGQCSDVYTHFSYSNVVAVLVPAASIRVSEVEISWSGVSNRLYQVQYRPSLSTNAWTNLGAPVPGDGSTSRVTDKVAPGDLQRVYRVITLP